MGIGLDHIVIVQTDSKGMMKPKALTEAIKKSRGDGLEPYFVNATAGTTVFGAYDPLDEIAKICKKEKLWLHVDVSIEF